MREVHQDNKDRLKRLLRGISCPSDAVSKHSSFIVPPARHYARIPWWTFRTPVYEDIYVFFGKRTEDKATGFSLNVTETTEAENETDLIDDIEDGSIKRRRNILEEDLNITFEVEQDSDDDEEDFKSKVSSVDPTFKVDFKIVKKQPAEIVLNKENSKEADTEIEAIPADGHSLGNKGKSPVSTGSVVVINWEIALAEDEELQNLHGENISNKGKLENIVQNCAQIEVDKVKLDKVKINGSQYGSTEQRIETNVSKILVASKASVVHATENEQLCYVNNNPKLLEEFVISNASNEYIKADIGDINTDDRIQTKLVTSEEKNKTYYTELKIIDFDVKKESSSITPTDIVLSRQTQVETSIDKLDIGNGDRELEGLFGIYTHGQCNFECLPNTNETVENVDEVEEGGMFGVLGIFTRE